MGNKTSMPDFNVNTIRNIGIIAHIDAGKTTLTERFLYYSGKTHHIGSVEDGTTVMDYLPEEQERGITIVAATATFQWIHNNKSHLLHLIDTPGHMDFTAEVERSLSVVDGAIVIFSATRGVEAQSEKVWHQSDKYKIPKVAFINKLDRDGSSFYTVLNEIREKFTNIRIIPLTIPIRLDNELIGIIDLVENQAVFYDGENNSEMNFLSIPTSQQEEVKRVRDEMISIVAELSAKIESAYLNDQPINSQTLKNEIRKYVLKGELCPVLAGSSKYNIGIQHLIEAAIDYLPTPIEHNNSIAINNDTGKVEHINIIEYYFTAVVFKLTITEHTELLYLKINSGSLTVNDEVKNSRTGKKYKIKRLLRIYSGKVNSIKEAFAGDIVGVIGPEETRTGDTLCCVSKSLMFENIIFPEPMVSIAIEPDTSRDKKRLEQCLKILAKEDPTIHFYKDPNTEQLILSGMGGLHLEVNIHRLQNEFQIALNYGEPRINYKESFSHKMDITGHFKKQIGPNLLEAEIDFSITPLPLDSDELHIIFDKRASIPNTWQTVIVKTFNDILQSGGNWSFPIHFVEIEVHGVRCHKEHTTEGALSGAVIDGVQQAIEQGTYILEPLMSLDVFTPDETYEPIKAYLLRHRAVVNSTDILPNGKHLTCLVPLKETLKLGKELPKVSTGRAAFTMKTHSFQVLPHHLIDKIKTL